MKPLGIGTRVFVGWVPEDKVVSGCEVYRLQEGVIVDGPKHMAFHVGSVVWKVDINGVMVNASECILTPIDDDPESVERDSEVTADV
jgi:hypothetical protein